MRLSLPQLAACYTLHPRHDSCHALWQRMSARLDAGGGLFEYNASAQRAQRNILREQLSCIVYPAELFTNAEAALIHSALDAHSTRSALSKCCVALIGRWYLAILFLPPMQRHDVASNWKLFSLYCSHTCTSPCPLATLPPIQCCHLLRKIFRVGPVP